MKNQILKTQTLKRKNFVSTNFVFKFFICVFYFLFCIFNIAFADTLPPLPIDELKKIELQYNDTLIKPFPLDTLQLKIYAGNVFGGSLKFVGPIKNKSFLLVNASVDKNYDYADYFILASDINFGWLTKYFWHELGLAGFSNQKESRYYQNIGITYNPVWFIKPATVRLSNQFRGARYNDIKVNNFITANSILSLTLPSLVGIIKSDAKILFQSSEKIKDENILFSQVNFSDLIAFSDNFYVQPGVNYILNKPRLGINLNSGIFLGGVLTFLDLSLKQVQTFYFDTLYSHINPYLTNNNLNYPISDWNIKLSAVWKNFDIAINYQQYSSYQTWHPNQIPFLIEDRTGQEQDSWIVPNISDSIYNMIGFNIKNKWRFLTNSFNINYTPEKLNLIPYLIIADSIRADLGKFDISTDIYRAENRQWYNQTLPGYLIFNCQVGYHWKFFRMFAGAENLFDNKYEILPDRFTLARKYFAGIEIKK